ncbi:MAG: Gfo/Idh/MocA family oxidoreductase, partial [Lachnospiraceae bacterium]|nr:Gfo/Idh/MocA family oxidoreductase [Lachnospiraceae bacterium]
ALGDYLIVGVTSDDFDKRRGKINNRQSLAERMAAVEATGLADLVIVEEYEGQKIDDIRKYGADIFTLGSDWTGRFDYLKDYCEVVYLPRTEGISSTELRNDRMNVRIGLLGETDSELTSIPKFEREAGFVQGLTVSGTYASGQGTGTVPEDVDAVYIASHPSKHAGQIRAALEAGKHVLCESPIALDRAEASALFSLAEEKGLVLMDAVKTAYVTAYERLLLLIKSGRIGDVVSVDAVCTSLKDVAHYTEEDFGKNWNTLTEWGPVALLPVFQILGTGYTECRLVSKVHPGHPDFDLFSKIEFVYPGAVASVRIGKAVKSEGELVVSGTKGYIIVPAPWWKTDYFEIRYEDPEENRRCFYPVEGEGIRYEIVAFLKAVRETLEAPGAAANVPADAKNTAGNTPEDAGHPSPGHASINIPRAVSEAVCGIMERFYGGAFTRIL